jgi:predicted phosphate transport protein (TIGR00153 family)
MFARFMPKEARFFDLFVAHADLCKQGSRELVALLANLKDADVRIKNIETLEKKADKITHDTVDLLHKSFITPLDRDQIHTLINTMDDILDLMEDVGQCITLYDVRSVTPDACALAEIGVQCCDRIFMVVSLMHDLTDTESIMKICGEIDRLESDADRVMRRGMGRLFRDEADTRQLIKMKAVYEMLEEITDRCEDVANLIEGIVLENA